MEEPLLASQMTLRDAFAAAALQGWLSGPCRGDVLDDVAGACYDYADAMLAERDKTKGGDTA